MTFPPIDHKIRLNFGPLYWRHESSSSKLRKAVTAYLSGSKINLEQAAYIRAYLRQWIYAPLWDLTHCSKARFKPELEELRKDVHGTLSLSQLKSWLTRAAAVELDPL